MLRVSRSFISCNAAFAGGRIGMVLSDDDDFGTPSLPRTLRLLIRISPRRSSISFQRSAVISFGLAPVQARVMNSGRYQGSIFPNAASSSSRESGSTSVNGLTRPTWHVLEPEKPESLTSAGRQSKQGAYPWFREIGHRRGGSETQ